MAAEVTGAQRGGEGVVLALGGAAGVGVDGLLRRWRVDDGGVVVGVTHARGGQLGEHGFEGGAALGGEQAAQRRHAVGALRAQREAASAGAVGVGVGAIGVEAVGEGVGQRGQLFGAKAAALAGQPGFGALAGGGIDIAGQLVHEAADHRDLSGAELAGALARGGGGQHRAQRFPAQPAPRA